MRASESFGRRMALARKGVYLSWALSYAVILLLPLTAWTAMQVYSNSIIDSMTHQVSSDVLAMVMSAVDNRLEQIDDIANALAVEKQLESYASGPADVVSLNAYRRYQVVTLMEDYRGRSKELLEDIFLYDEATDDIVSAVIGYLRAGDFFKARYHRDPKALQSAAEWRGVLQSARDGARFGLLDLAGGAHALYLLKRVPLAAPFVTGMHDLTMAVEMKPTWLSRLIEELDLADGIGLNIEWAAGRSMLSIPAGEGGAKRVVELRATGKAGWLFTLSVPEQIYLNGTGNLRAWMPAALAGTVLLGALLATYLLRRNYAPLLSVMNLIAVRAETPGEAVGEYEYLTQAFRKLMNEHSLERRQMEAQAGRLRNAYMTQLLLDSALEEEQKREYLTLLGFSEDSNALVVAAVRERSGQALDPGQVAEAMGIGHGKDSAYYGCGVQLRGDAVFLLDCLDMSPEELREEMETMRQRLGLRYWLADGGAGTEAGGIAGAWAEACRKLRQMSSAPPEAGDEAAQCPRPESVRVGRAEAAAAALKEQILRYIDEHFTDPNLNVGSICEHFGNAPSTVFRLFREEGESGLLNQINGRRIEQARGLLLQKSELSTAKIGREVGFSSLNTFIRQFKRVTGVTPGKFREIAGMVWENREE